MSSASSRLMLRHNRVFARRTGLRYASTTSEATQAASKTVEKGKETASSATSKASSGLSKVTSSTGPAVSGAAQGVTNYVNKTTGRLGRLANYVQCEYEPCCVSLTVLRDRMGLLRIRSFMDSGLPYTLLPVRSSSYKRLRLAHLESPIQ